MKNKFYRIRSECDPKVTGLKNGGVQAELIKDGFKNKDGYDLYNNYFHSSNTEDNLEHYKAIPPFNIDLQCIKMVDKAKVTDFISFKPILPVAKYLVSAHVVDILSTFKLSEYKFYQTTIFSKENILSDYKLLYSPTLGYDYINFAKSLFFTGDGHFSKEFKTFADYSKFFSFCKTKEFAYADTICLKKNFDTELDFFNIILSPDFFISEELKETFEIAGITGINFVEPKDPKLIFEE